MKTSTTANKIIKYLIVAIIWLSIWEVLALAINEELLFASPYRVLLALGRMCCKLTFWETILFSILRILGGFLLGYVLSVVLSVLTYRFPFFETFIRPAISVVKATPVASFIILALIWSDKNFVPVIICVLMVTPIVWSNLTTGLKNVDGGLLSMAQVYGMTTIEKVKHIYIHSIAPYNFSAIGSGLGLCWKAGIAAEVICRALPSIGNSIWETKFYLITDEMFAWTTVVVILSVIFDKLTRVLISKFSSPREVSK